MIKPILAESPDHQVRPDLPLNLLLPVEQLERLLHVREGNLCGLLFRTCELAKNTAELIKSIVAMEAATVEGAKRVASDRMNACTGF